MISYKNHDLGLLFIRLGLAAVFIIHGWMKFQNLEGTAAFLGGLGFAPFFAYILAAVEFFSGLAMLFGIFTDLAGILLAIVMVIAIVTVKLKMGFVGGYELDLTLLLAALAVVCIGPGKYAIRRRR